MKNLTQEQVRIFLRPIGSGLPLGFFAFGIGMLLLGTQALGWIPVDEQSDVGRILISFVFPLELLGTVMAFLARDTLGATTLGLFTTSWLVAGGFGLALAALAMYGGTALALEHANRRELLPLFRRGGAEAAFHGYEAQRERLESERGVRRQL